MGQILIGNAPCSWGSLEFDGLDGDPIGCEQMLDELVETGYEGTELGDWGFMPTDIHELAAALASRRVALLGAFVPAALADASRHAAGQAAAVRTAALVAGASAENNDRFPPFLVLADDNGSDPTRTANAGRVTPELSLSDSQWQVFARGANQIAREVLNETGLRTVFHHHCAGFVETPAEIERLLELTDPDLLGLVFDTGHLLYGSGANDPHIVGQCLDRFRERIWYVHFKDCHPAVAEECRREGADYFTAVARGVFCELGQGSVDFQAVVRWLEKCEYEGWAVVEQDVLPGMGAPRESAARNRAYLRTLGI